MAPSVRTRRVRESAQVLVAVTALCVMAVWCRAAPGATDGPNPEIERLLGQLQDPSSTVRNRAAVELVQLAPHAHEAIPALTAALSDRFQPVRWNAAKALGLMGPAASSAVPALATAVKTSDWSGSAQVMAAWALGRIGPAAKVRTRCMPQTWTATAATR